MQHLPYKTPLTTTSRQSCSRRPLDEPRHPRGRALSVRCPAPSCAVLTPPQEKQVALLALRPSHCIVRRYLSSCLPQPLTPKGLSLSPLPSSLHGLTSMRTWSTLPRRETASCRYLFASRGKPFLSSIPHLRAFRAHQKTRSCMRSFTGFLISKVFHILFDLHQLTVSLLCRSREAHRRKSRRVLARRPVSR